MDTGLQKHRTRRWMRRVFVVLSLAVSLGAQADREYVAPLSEIYWIAEGYSVNGVYVHYTSADDACNFLLGTLLDDHYLLNTYIGIIPYRYNKAGNLMMTRCTWDLNIFQQTAWATGTVWINGYVYGIHRYDRLVTSMMQCPDPIVNPTLKYTFDWDTATCSREAQFTITLSGGTEVEPSKGSDIETLPIIATVRQSNGQLPVNPVKVHISLKVEDPKSGGHDHGDSTRPRGGIADKKVCASDSECWKNPTVNGAVKFNFNAPEASGKYTITAICDGCSNTATKPVNVKVNELEPIPAFPYYALEESDPDNPGTTKVIGATGLHSKNHYLTHAAAQRLMMIAIQYHSHPKFRVLDRKTKTKVPPPPLHVNDASLEWGGKFDNKGTWTGSHAEHRRGTSVDLRANENVGAIPPELFEEFEKLIKKHIPGGDTKGKGKFLRECTPNEQPTESNPNPIQHNRMPINYCVSQVDGSFDTNRHYHVRLLGE